MTDLESLECIVVDLVPKAKEHNKEEIEQIKKSLEVLDIIKNHILNVGIDISGIYLKSTITDLMNHITLLKLKVPYKLEWIKDE